MVGFAAQVDQIGLTTGQANVGLAGLAGAVDDTADDRHVERFQDILQALFQGIDRGDHIEILA